MSKLTLKAEKRKLLGRKVKQLRKEGVVPANIYGKKIKSESIKVSYLDFEKVYKEAGETSILEIQIGKDKKPALVHNVQIDPVSDKILHVDFLQVNLKEKVSAEIPIELLGESPAEKQGLGTVVQYMGEVAVEALPTDLPEKFEVDVTILTEVDNAVYLKDLKYDRNKVEVKEDLEKIIVKVEPIREEEEEPVGDEVVEEEKLEEGVGEEEEKKEGETKEEDSKTEASE